MSSFELHNENLIYRAYRNGDYFTDSNGEHRVMLPTEEGMTSFPIEIGLFNAIIDKFETKGRCKNCGEPSDEAFCSDDCLEDFKIAEFRRDAYGEM